MAATSPTTTTTKAIRIWAARPRARARLICFPWAGGSALAFRPWAVSFPEHIEVCAIEYPGRGAREDEPLLDGVAALVEQSADLVAALLDRPFIVLGYSLGALVAYEWLRRLGRGGSAPPLHFVVCARRAPHLPARHARLASLPTDELVGELRRRFDAIPEVLLGEPELLARFLVPLRADLHAVEAYAYEPGEPLACPLSAFGGRADLDVSAAELDAWREHTGGAFRTEQLEAGHFFAGLPRLRAAVLDLFDRG